ncbi:14275_t:CDS:2, partial [Gigaspora margarita]
MCTRFSEPNVLGFNNEIIVEQLQAEVLFFPFQIIAHDIVIVVIALGSSDQVELNFADIYYQENKIRTYTRKFPNDVWSKPDILKNYDSKNLFGLCDQLVIQTIQTYITVPY